MRHAKQLLLVAGATLLTLSAQAVSARDLIVSGNDGKYQRVKGTDTYLEHPPADTLTVLDASRFPPSIVSTTVVENGVQGPPQAVAVTPDGSLAFVASPTRYDQTQKHLIMDTFLQVVSLSGAQSGTVSRIELGSHPQAIAVNRAGTLALVTCVDGAVRTFQIAGDHVTADGMISLSKQRLAGISFTHDGKHALVALRDEQGIAVLNIAGGKVSDNGDRLSTGVAPYTVDVSSDGKWAVVSDVGLAGLPHYAGRILADEDSITLIDVSHTPFRAVQHLDVPSAPEGVAISPNGEWIAAQSMGGSHLPADNPGRHATGEVVLFQIRNGKALEVSRAPSGEAAQGIVFTADSKHVIVQFNVERQLALYSIKGTSLIDDGVRIPVGAGPSSIRSLPR